MTSKIRWVEAKYEIICSREDEAAEDILGVGSVLVGFYTYMVSIVVTIRVLHSSPLDGSALRCNHSNL